MTDILTLNNQLAPGMMVEARWCNLTVGSHRSPARVVTVHKSSVRVEVLEGYLAGQTILVPRVFAQGFSVRNGVGPLRSKP